MSHTHLEVCRDPSGGRVRVVVRSDGPRGRGHLGIRVLDARPDRARVAVLAESALLVAGDDVSVGMRVGPGVRLDVVEPAGTVAYDMRGGSARWTVGVEVDDGGTLVWGSQPFVVSTGARVTRRVTVSLAGRATTLLREVLVIGRAGETGGSLNQFVRVTHDGSPLLAEDLRVDGARPSVGVFGRRRVQDTVSVLGRRATGIPTPDGAHRPELDGEGTLLRSLCAAVHLSPLDPTWSAVCDVSVR